MVAEKDMLWQGSSLALKPSSKVVDIHDQNSTYCLNFDDKSNCDLLFSLVNFQSNRELRAEKQRHQL